MKLVITDAKTVTQGDLSLDCLNEFADVTVYERLLPDDYAQALCDADLVLCNKTIIDTAFLDAAPRLKFVGLFATGYNNVDLIETRRRGITVCNVPSYSTMAVAQHTFAMILHFASRVADYHEFVDNGGWKNSATFSPFVFPTHELYGKTLGIIGYGSIGQQVGRLGEAFGMRVIAYSRHPKEGVTCVSLTDLLQEADYITCHCPLNSESRGLIGEKELRLCKPTAIIINTARGGIIDEHALAAALHNGTIAGAGIDVLETEPMAQNCPLFGAKNCVMTPHIAWAPLETRIRLLDVVCDNLRAFLNGDPIHVVN